MLEAVPRVASGGLGNSFPSAAPWCGQSNILRGAAIAELTGAGPRAARGSAHVGIKPADPTP
jgi:hypothetical protein